jgi:hypothetical protein
MRNQLLGAALLAASIGFSSPAMALTQLNDCNAAPADIKGGYTQTCAGYFSGNLNNASDFDATRSALAAATPSFPLPSGAFGSFTKVESGSGISGTTINFGQKLYGETVFSIHYGAGQGPANPKQNSTAFYRVDFGSAGVTSFQTEFGSVSNAVLFSTGAVPEPATWAMMIGGFGLIGAASRRRRTTIAYA